MTTVSAGVAGSWINGAAVVTGGPKHQVINPATGDVVNYLLPRSTNIRRVFVDNSTNPVSFWAGSPLPSSNRGRAPVFFAGISFAGCRRIRNCTIN